jgi:agmatinase
MPADAPPPPPDNFLALEDPYATFEAARVLILPVPLEASVSWGTGTAHGPQAIIAASRHVELYDRDDDGEPALGYGIHTLPALALSDDPAVAIAEIAAAVCEASATGRLVVALGGEHTISAGVNHGLLDARGGPLTVVQLDAHSDLRDTYEGTPFSHACVARRILEDPRVEQLLQLGVRSVDAEEVAFARAHEGRVRTWYAEDIHGGAWREEFVARVRGRRIHLTIDVDGIDPAIVPATGTPEPDGLSWRETLEIISTTAAEGAILGIDCVELAPQPGLHHADFAVAKLLYKTITYALNGG